MKLLHVCYAALGFAVARWFFRRETVAMADPVARLRVSGLLWGQPAGRVFAAAQTGTAARPLLFLLRWCPFV